VLQVDLRGRTLWGTFAVVVVAALLALGAYYGFNIRWGDYGTGDWLAYWSIPRGLLLGHGYFDSEWLAALQQSAGYNQEYKAANNYEVWVLWNPPPFVTLLMPFGAFGFTAATLVWIAFSALLYAHAATLFNRELENPLPEWVAMLLPLFFLPFLAAMFWGQITPVLGAFIIYAWLAQRRGRHAAAGILLVPLLLKPHLLYIAAMLLLLVALRRRWWSTWIVGGGFAAILVLVAFVLDPNWVRGWTTQGSPTEWQSLAVWDVLKTGFSLPEWIQYLGMLIGLLVGLYRYRNVTEATPRLLGEATLLSVLFNPYLWHHDVTVTAPAALLIAARLWHWHPLLRWALLGMTALNLWLMPFSYLSVKFLPYMVLYLTLWLWTGWRTRRQYAQVEQRAPIPRDGPKIQPMQ
jgi:hypothetical protein